ncbi:MAG: 50S ribosomal protein L11 [Candidatus Hydrothermarchaeaceae archaeon]
MKQSIRSLVEGGKASGGPPLGPALGPLGVNIGAVIDAINEKTKEFDGMKVPVAVLVDPTTKEFEIDVGTPPTSALILKELGIEKGSGDSKTDIAGDLTLASARKVAGMKRKGMLADSTKAAVREVLGTCVSMGITVEGKPAKEFLREIEQGLHDDALKEEA